MQVKPSSVYEFEVVDLDGRIFVVNLEDGTCHCRVFQLDQFLCPHAVAACRKRAYQCMTTSHHIIKKIDMLQLMWELCIQLGQNLEYESQMMLKIVL